MSIFDLHTFACIFGVALAGGIVGLDRTAVGQFMISQPVVVGPLTGWLLGDLSAGLVIGAVLELVWVLDMPVGTFVPADATVGAVSATAIAVLGSGGNTQLDVIGFSVLFTTIAVPITMRVDGITRKFNSRLAETAADPMAEDAGRALSRAHLAGLIVFFLKSFILYLVFVPAGLIAVTLFGRAPEKVHDAMTLFVKVLPLLGTALVVRKQSIKIFDRFFLAGFVVAAMSTLVFHVPALIIIPLVIMVGILGAQYGEGAGHRQQCFRGGNDASGGKP